MSLQEIFFDNLKFFRKQKKLTQMELTLAIDKGYNYINGVEQGKLFPSVEVIEKLAEVLEISPAALFDENSIAKNIIKLNIVLNRNFSLKAIKLLALKTVKVSHLLLLQLKYFIFCIRNSVFKFFYRLFFPFYHICD